MEVASCHPLDNNDLEVAPRFLKMSALLVAWALKLFKNCSNIAFGDTVQRFHMKYLLYNHPVHYLAP